MRYISVQATVWVWANAGKEGTDTKTPVCSVKADDCSVQSDIMSLRSHRSPLHLSLPAASSQ